MGFFDFFKNFNNNNTNGYNLNTVFTHSNGKEMRRYMVEEVKPIKEMILNKFKDLRDRPLRSENEYPVQLTEAQAVAVQKIAEHKRQGKFALANHEYIDLVKTGPISWALLSSWAKVLLCATMLVEAMEILAFAQMILEKHGDRNPFSRSAHMLRVLMSQDWYQIRQLIIENSGIPNFIPLEYEND